MPDFYFNSLRRSEVDYFITSNNLFISKNDIVRPKTKMIDLYEFGE